MNATSRVFIYSKQELSDFKQSHKVSIPESKLKYISEPCYRGREDFVIDGFTEFVRIFELYKSDDGTFYLDKVHDVLHEIGTDRYYNILTTSSSSGSRLMYHLSIFTETYDEHVRLYSVRFNEPSPNRIGVVTPTKIRAWFDYLTREYNFVCNYWNKIDNHRESFERQASHKGYRINWYTHTHGFIEKGRFRFDFHIAESGISYSSLSVIPGRGSITFDDFDRLQQVI